MNRRLWNAVDRRFRNHEIEGAIALLEGRLAQVDIDRFKSLIGAEFTNHPERILQSINAFIDGCTKEFPVKAIYLEMNGFAINPNRWFFDFFGYSAYGADADDLEWLCGWQSNRSPDITLTGLETAQADFDWFQAHEGDHDNPTISRAYDLACLLVMSKYVSLIQRALFSGPLLKPIPILATAHDFDIVGRFEPA